MLCGSETTSLFVKLDKVDCVVQNLLSICGAQPRSFEFQDRYDAIAKENTVHAKTAASEVKLEENVTKRSQVRSREGGFENSDLFGAVVKFALKNADAGLPLVMLFALDVQPLGSCAAGQLPHYDRQWIANKRLTILHVPRGTIAH